MIRAATGSIVAIGQDDPLDKKSLRADAPARRARVNRPWVAELLTALYIGLIGAIAQASGLFYVLFPELGALSHDVFKRPEGAWARSPVLLVLTTTLAALGGTLITRHLPYGVPAVLLDVGWSALVIGVLRSPFAPALSAGLMPLVLGIRSGLYPPSILFGTAVLAAASLAWRRIGWSLPAPASLDPDDDIVERAPAEYGWVPFFVAFLLLAILTGERLGLRLVLFPPLTVIGFETFAHPTHCPWAGRPAALLAACGLTATVGVACASWVEPLPLAAMLSILAGGGILWLLDVYVPPALAVGLLPFVMSRPEWSFPLAVLIGTALQLGTFAAWRASVRLRRAPG